MKAFTIGLVVVIVFGVIGFVVYDVKLANREFEKYNRVLGFTRSEYKKGKTQQEIMDYLTKNAESLELDAISPVTIERRGITFKGFVIKIANLRSWFGGIFYGTWDGMGICFDQQTRNVESFAARGAL